MNDILGELPFVFNPYLASELRILILVLLAPALRYRGPERFHSLPCPDVPSR